MYGVPLSDILRRGENNFDAVRLLAAASVIVSHAFFLATGTDDAEPLWSVSVFTLSQHAVNVFFILSGVLVAASLDRSDSLLRFAAGRALRIVPGLVVCAIVVTFVLGPAVTMLAPADYFASSGIWRYLAATLTLSSGSATLPGVFAGLPVEGLVNVPLWTLKYEVLSYLLLTGLAIAGIWSRPVLYRLFLAGLALAYLSQLGQRPVADHGVLDHMLRFFACFFIGVTAYRLRHRLRLSALGAAVAVAGLAAAHGTVFEEAASFLSVGYLMLCAAALPLGSARATLARADLSYGLYIYGWPVTQTILLFAPGTGPYMLAAAALLATAALALMSWQLIEKPALALRKRLPARLPASARRATA